MRGWTGILAAALVLCLSEGTSAMSLRDAVERAVRNNPDVLESAANRRAVDQELRQAESAFSPIVSLEGRVGPQFYDQPNAFSEATNEEWRVGSEIAIVARQVLFDGFRRSNELYRQAARIDGAAYRVLERSEIVALDTVEAYIDIARHRQILAIVDDTVRVFGGLRELVQERLDAGTETAGSVFQANERIAAAQAIRGDVVTALGEVNARFERLVGHPPGALGAPPFPKPIPATMQAARAEARARYPSVAAATADVEAARSEVEQAGGDYLPTLSLEGTARYGYDVDGTPGRDEEYSIQLQLSWDIYDGGLRDARRSERVERLGEARVRQDRVRMDLDEMVARAYAELAGNDERLAALLRQLQAADGVVTSYREEYDAGTRSLLDLLDAENARFSTRVSRVSSDAVAMFTRYRIISLSRSLLTHFNIATVDESLAGTLDDFDLRPVNGFSIEPLRRW
ncbi:MAG: TolC family outer membrane protein [Pseudomonadota bacterium]